MVLFGLTLVALCLLGVSSAADFTPLAGDLDPSFGSGGIVVAQSLGSIRGIAVQPDGKIVVAGESDAGFSLARFLPDGSPDQSFGSGGHVATSFADGGVVGAVALQSDGKIVVAGGNNRTVMGNSAFVLARYTPSGSLDPNFGADGITKTVIPTAYPPSDAAADALAVLPDGKILAGGTSSHGDGYGYGSTAALVRYTSNGALDSTFGDGGIVQPSVNGGSGLSGIVVQPDGDIVAVGTADGSHPYYVEQMMLVRYKPDGSLDARFGSGGAVATSPKSRYSGGPSVLQGGKIVVAGAAHNAFLVLARFDARGHLDPTFAKDGFAENRDVGGAPSAVVEQSDRKIVVAASGYAGEEGAVVRLLPDGRLDPSFGEGGIVRFGSVALALQSDGKILDGWENGSVLARLGGGSNCIVPGLRGATVPKARTDLKKASCGAHLERRFSKKVARGRVILTRPRAGLRVPGGTKVRVVVSRGRYGR
jgi:uncharacterized delta-60 repeat protein